VVLGARGSANLKTPPYLEVSEAGVVEAGGGLVVEAGGGLVVEAGGGLVVAVGEGSPQAESRNVRVIRTNKGIKNFFIFSPILFFP
jgi:hypothetical protein